MQLQVSFPRRAKWQDGFIRGSLPCSPPFSPLRCPLPAHTHPANLHFEHGSRLAQRLENFSCMACFEAEGVDQLRLLEKLEVSWLFNASIPGKLRALIEEREGR